MKVDFSNALSKAVADRGIKEEHFMHQAKSLAEIKRNILMRMKDEYFSLTLPNVMVNFEKEIEDYAANLQNSFDNFVVVGMGGSSLGNIMLHSAFGNEYAKGCDGRNVFFLDTVDPETLQRLFRKINIERTVFNIVTKSGDTTETIQNFFFIYDTLRKRKLPVQKHLIFTTDPERGFLRFISKEKGIETFPVHPFVGGRYSVLSHVGLISAAFEGIDIKELLSGARTVLQSFLENDPSSHAAILLALLQYEMCRNLDVRVSVFFSYSDALYQVGEWYKQLLAESIGKEKTRDNVKVNNGLLPLPARGPSDQHSILQLFMEGPYDKLVVFLYPKSFRTDFEMPASMDFETASVSHLLGREYSDLIFSELKATRAALTKAKRPNVSIELDSINERELGKLILFLELSVVALGEMFNVNPVNQPAVELGKRYTFSLMGKQGFEKERLEFESISSTEGCFVLEV